MTPSACEETPERAEGREAACDGRARRAPRCQLIDPALRVVTGDVRELTDAIARDEFEECANVGHVVAEGVAGCSTLELHE